MCPGKYRVHISMGLCCCFRCCYLRAVNYFCRVFDRQPLGYQVRKENWIYFEQNMVMMHVQKMAIHTQANSVRYSNRNRIRVVMPMQPLAPYLNSSNKKCLICVVNCAVRMFFVPKKETVEPNIYCADDKRDLRTV